MNSISTHMMKHLPRFLALVAISLAHAFGSSLVAAPVGYWEGVIRLPAVELEIRVELESSDDGLGGSIDIPVQGMRGFELSGVSFEGDTVEFGMAGIPGDPKFSGTLAEDADTITGEFTQSGQTFPFALERKPKPEAAAGETPAKGVPGSGIVGHWQASLKPSPVMELRLVLVVTNSPAGEPGGTLISVDQGNTRMATGVATGEDGAVDLQVPSVGAAYEGRFSDDGSEIEGTWKQGPGALPLVFKRLAQAPDFSRPQEPKRPYPYDEEEVVINNPDADLQLAGTLTLPRGEGPHPAVVLITGSGPQDRDEAIMGHRPFLVLADHLTRRGIAVLRYDDRGVGESTGDFRTATHYDFVTDALAAVEWLKTREGIDPDRIGLVGHSEGGVVAPLAAVKQPDDVAFIVLLAGVGVPMDELLERQGRDILRVMGVDADTLEKSVAAQREVFRLLKGDADPAVLEEELRAVLQRQVDQLTEEQRRAADYSDAMMRSQLQTVLTPWFRTLLAYDPRPTLRQVTCPVLAINGEKDLQVAPKDNLEAIAAALKEGGNERVRTVEFPGLNHLFQTCTTGAIAEYGQIEETFNPAALSAVSDWIRQQAGLD